MPDQSAGQPSGYGSVHQSRPEHPGGVSELSSGQSCRNHLGDGQRQAVGRENQDNVVHIKGSGIVSHALVPDDICHGDPVHQPNQTHNNAGHGKDRSLNHKIPGLFPFGFCRFLYRLPFRLPLFRPLPGRSLLPPVFFSDRRRRYSPLSLWFSPSVRLMSGSLKRRRRRTFRWRSGVKCILKIRKSNHSPLRLPSSRPSSSHSSIHREPPIWCSL